MSRPRSMKDYIAFEREFQKAAGLTGAALEESIAFCAGVESAPKEEIEAYDFFLSHLPEDETDLVALVLRVQLLLEYRINEFVAERMLNPDALSRARLSAAQILSLAEALTLPNDGPRWLWEMVRRLNSMRNALAHNLEPKGIQEKLDSFTAEYSKHHGMHGAFIDCAGHLYAQISELARLARRPEFQVRGRRASP